MTIKLEKISVHKTGDIFELRVSFNNDKHHAVYLEKGDSPDKVAAKLHLIVGSISTDKDLKNEA